MGGLFSKPKTPKTPAPEAIPEVEPEVEDFAARRVRRKRGYQSTIITGALEPNTGKKTTLG